MFTPGDVTSANTDEFHPFIHFIFRLPWFSVPTPMIFMLDPVKVTINLRKGLFSAERRNFLHLAPSVEKNRLSFYLK
jgi:hypothetical protein